MLPNPSCWEDTVGKGKLRVMLIGGVGVDRSQQSVHTRSVIRRRDERASGKKESRVKKQVESGVCTMGECPSRRKQ